MTDIAGLLAHSTSPVLVTGPGAASDLAWTALSDLADKLDCPVYQETFLTARPGFPQDHPRFAGFLPPAAPPCGPRWRPTTPCWSPGPRCCASTTTSPARWSSRHQGRRDQR